MSTGAPINIAAGKPGDMASDPSHELGVYARNHIAAPLMRPFYNATRDSKHIPGWANSLITGGLAGGILGGVVNKIRGGDFLTGAGWGAGIGAAGLGALGFMSRNDDWGSKIPLIGGMFRKDKTLDTDSAPVVSKTGRKLTHLTPEQQRKKLIAGAEMEKNQSFEKSAMDKKVFSKLYNDMSLTLMQKQHLANEVKYLSESKQRQLSQLVSGAFGSGVGFLIAKYLLGMGKYSTILTTIISGLSAANFAGGPPPKPTHDQWGKKYYM